MTHNSFLTSNSFPFFPYVIPEFRNPHPTAVCSYKRWVTNSQGRPTLTPQLHPFSTPMFLLRSVRPGVSYTWHVAQRVQIWSRHIRCLEGLYQQQRAERQMQQRVKGDMSVRSHFFLMNVHVHIIHTHIEWQQLHHSYPVMVIISYLAKCGTLACL